MTVPATTGTVLLTRPLEDSRAMADALAERGIDSLIWPLTRIVPVAPDIPLPPGVDAVLATSAHGIKAFATLWKRRDLPVLAVSGKTAETARRLGFASVLVASGDAKGLSLLAQGTGFRRLFYPRGREVSADLVAALQTPGRAVTEAVVYAAEPGGKPPAPVASALARGKMGAVTIWSRRNGAILAERLGAGLEADLTNCTLVAISQAAAEPLAAAGFARIEIASHPDAPSMLAATAALFSHLRQ